MNTRKHLIYLSAALAFAACSSDDALAPQQPATPAEAGQNIGFHASFGQPLQVLDEEDLDGGPSTRATIKTSSTSATEGFFGTWSTNDKISISDGALMYTYQPTSAAASAEFQPRTGKNSFTTNGTGEEGTFYAFYPADAVLGWNRTTVTTMIYTEQDYAENVENSGVMGPYMAAVATTTGGGANASFEFGHVCSVVDVDISSITDETVDAVALYANSQNSIAGKLTYKFDDKIIRVFNGDNTGYSNSTQSETVRVSNVPSGATVVRFYVLPVAQNGGFTITVHTTNNNYYTKSSSTSVGTSSVNGDYMANVYNGTTGTTVINGGACKPYYKKYNFGSTSSNKTRTQNWMAMIPGNVKFNHLSLPGAHDAATSACSNNSAKCQAYTVAELLNKGCRALDLRPYYNSSSLEIYHGIASTGVTLANALDAVKTFLTNNPTETVFILLAQEGGSDGNTNWQNRVWSCLSGYTDFIASYGWQGNLNPCRGKMVVIFRNTYTGGTNNGDRGCGKVGWGSSFNDKTILTGNGSVTGKGTLRYQDEYETTSTSTKLDNLTKMLNEHIAANETNAGYTFVNNVNIAGTLSNISSLSTSMNTAFLGSSTFTTHTGKFCIMMTDFLFSSSQKGDQMFELIHKQNYKYVYKNRTRCSTASPSGTDTGADISADEYADGSTVYVKQK